MTDNEIIKALPKMLYGGHTCMNCKYDNGKDNDRCGLKGCKIARYALDLINRQQAEIERLQKGNDELGKAIAGAYELNCFLEATRKIVRVEAIKEFAEKLKDDMVPNIDDTYIESFVEDYIDNLVKEMVGEER